MLKLIFLYTSDIPSLPPINSNRVYVRLSSKATGTASNEDICFTGIIIYSKTKHTWRLVWRLLYKRGPNNMTFSSCLDCLHVQPPCSSCSVICDMRGVWQYNHAAVLHTTLRIKPVRDDDILLILSFRLRSAFKVHSKEDKWWPRCLEGASYRSLAIFALDVSSKSEQHASLSCFSVIH